ncbi:MULTISPECIES: MarR family winged helix-turn-helix transcriptional regulator [unclassified Curtobacterium]|uniref:MarR family winged helix-turn-helix transcriptional regulator n=1 Tax=unclassified Curtobacterium TaxID=257496 RepID=UPI001C64B98F|nr:MULTISPECIES: MarR family transcriptional regulator [unclassified Curtobacterium]
MLDALRSFARANSEFGRAFAARERMHHTDAAAIVEILQAEESGRPLTPARLAELVMLTTGATSTLLKRLESAGHVVRTREHDDGRIVTLRTTATVHAAAAEFHQPLAAQLNVVLGSRSDEELESVRSVVLEVAECLRAAASNAVDHE